MYGRKYRSYVDHKDNVISSLISSIFECIDIINSDF